jgi:hypothetical protein
MPVGLNKRVQLYRVTYRGETLIESATEPIYGARSHCHGRRSPAAPAAA